MKRIFCLSLAAAALISAMSVPARAQDSDAPAENVKAKHGDWEVVCLTAKPEQCRMRQIGETADGKPALVVHVAKLKDAKTQDGKPVPGAIRITTPLGTLLREGLHLKIDGGQEQTGIYNICIPSGCIVSEPMSEAFLGQLKSGNAITLSFKVLQQKDPLSITISLKGFTKAFGTL